MKPTLIIIDMQKAFEYPVWGKRSNPHAEENALKLLGLWRKLGYPIVHIQHTSNNPKSLFYKGNDGHYFKEGFKPLIEEPIFQKNVNSAFIGTNLKGFLSENGINELVIVGLTVQHCVSTTTRMAGNYGFNVLLVEDATAAFEEKSIKGKVLEPQLIHEVEMGLLNNEFATVTNTETVIKRFNIL